MGKIQIEIDEKYQEALDLLKQIIPDSNWEPITDDGKMIEALIDSFMAFIQEQVNEESNWDWHCGSDWCGCNH